MAQKDPEARKVYRIRYRAEHPEKIKAYQAQYCAEHAGEIKAQKARYAAEHADEIKAYNRTRRINRPGKMRAKDARRRVEHPEEIRAYNAQRRARKANAPINDFTAAQWRELQTVADHRCAYCGRRAKGHLTQDHIQPLSDGGSHTLSNIVPACRSCNAKKHVGPPPVPVQPLLLTVAPSKKKKAA